MTERKKLIEVALPLVAINDASAREKRIRYGHPSTLHLWWARRPLATARVMIFTSLVDDPDNEHAPRAFVEACRSLPKGQNTAERDTPRMRLFDFIERLVVWNSTTDEEVLETARQLINLCTDNNPPPLLDPFAGGGSIPVEAQRLGLEAHANDLNPVAVMINKAQIEIPILFSNISPINPDTRENDSASGIGWKGAAGLAADVRYYGAWMRQEAHNRIGHFYPDMNGETVVAWIWARAVKSPNPAIDAYVPLVKNFWLSKKKDNRAWIEPVVDKSNNKIRYIVNKGSGQPRNGTMSRSGGECIISGSPISFEYIQEQAQSGNLNHHLMAVVTTPGRGRNFHSPNEEHERVANLPEPDWKPEFLMSTHSQYMAPPRYGMSHFSDLFTSRQLVGLNTLSELVNEAKDKAYQDAIKAGMSSDEISLKDNGKGARAYSEAIATFLGMAVSRLSDIYNALCMWEVSKTQVRHVFTRQALPILWDFAENNLFSDSAGDFGVTLGTMLRVVERFTTENQGYVYQSDAQTIDIEKQVMVSTDPPYYDAVPYADLSDFFYVWMRKTLKEIYPNLFSTMMVPKSAELVADRERHSDQDTAEEHFESGMLNVFRNVRRNSFPEIPLTVYYAFKQSEITSEGESSTGWETILEGLIQAGFTINGTWPVRTELSNRMRSIGSNALASSIVLVCRPRPEDAPMITRREFLKELRSELPESLENMASGNIAPVDLAQASIGPGMAVYSRYSKVLEADGSPLTVRSALQIINQELDAYLSEQEGNADADTRFAIAWFDQYGFDEGEFGQADVLARAKNTSVSGIQEAGVVDAERGKVRLVHWEEYDPGSWSPQNDERATVWEATHHLIERLNHHGEKNAAMLLNRMPGDMAADARQLAYRLYSICERKDRSEHARDYNALVISWPAIQEEANRIRDAQEAGDATRQDELPGFSE